MVTAEPEISPIALTEAELPPGRTTACGEGPGGNRIYVLVTPVKDEVGTIGKTIASVANQTILPKEWVIVSDGSTDGTDDIVREAVAKYPWIKLIQLPQRAERSFSAVVENTERGIAELQTSRYEYVGLLDADVTFQSDYFEQLIRHFDTDPLLGLAGGVVIDIGTPRDLFPRNRVDVPGAVQFFRRRCFESLGGLIAIPEGGWDALTCVVARMHKFRTRLCTDLVVDHLKPRNISQGGIVRRKWQMGVRDYALGYHPIFEVVKCAGRLLQPPTFIGAIAHLVGYIAASVGKTSRLVPQAVVAEIRREQKVRLYRDLNPLSRRFSPPGSLEVSSDGTSRKSLRIRQAEASALSIDTR